MHFYASMATSHGFEFSFQVNIEENCSYITGDAWNEFLKVFSLEAGDEIVLKLDTGSPTTQLIPGNYPNNHQGNIHNFLCLNDPSTYSVQLVI